MPMSGRPAEILLVEDNPGDVRLIQEALKDGKILNNLHVAGDGEQALAFLRRQGPHAHAPTPDLVLLDLNLPRKNGRETLVEIKNDPTLATVPIVILTSSQEDADTLASYQLRANCYISKPVEFEQFVKVAHSVEDFWFSIVRLPQETT